MLVANDKLRAEFLLKIHKTAQQHFEESMDIWDQKKKELVSRAQDSLGNSLEALCKKYKCLQEEGKTGELRYVYLSFLRSGILCHTPWYRLDAYDSRDCISDVECTESWDFLDISHCLYSGAEKLKAEFHKQSRVKEYELDEIIFQLAEKFHQKTKGIFCEILEAILKEKGTMLLEDCCVDFMMGELFDKSEFLLGWNQGRIISAEEYRQQKEDSWEEGQANDI